MNLLGNRSNPEAIQQGGVPAAGVVPAILGDVAQLDTPLPPLAASWQLGPSQISTCLSPDAAASTDPATTRDPQITSGALDSAGTVGTAGSVNSAATSGTVLANTDAGGRGDRAQPVDTQASSTDQRAPSTNLDSLAPTKRATDRIGSSVALLIDRDRKMDIDASIPIGQRQPVGAWSCSQHGEFRCTGTLVSAEWILTAAHCVSTLTATGPQAGASALPDLWNLDLMARVGSVDSSDGGQLLTIDETRLHPQWSTWMRSDGSWGLDHSDMRNDLALLRLAEPVNLPTATVAAAPSNMGDQELMSRGWGQLNGGPTSALHEWKMEIADPRHCQANDSTDSFVAASMLCLDELDGSGTCLGDSGGGLSIPRSDGSTVTVAVTSFMLFPTGVYRCDQPRLVAFNSLSPSHVRWIKDVIDP